VSDEGWAVDEIDVCEDFACPISDLCIFVLSIPFDLSGGVRHGKM
jgi:hypothetical protein